MNWWEKNPERLATEAALMKEKFPQFRLGTSEANRKFNGVTMVITNQKYWVGNLKTVSGNLYTALIVYPEHYPGREIRAYITDPTLKSPDHRYGNGHLCLYSNDHGGRGQGFGKGMTAVSYVGWTAAWLHAYEYSLKTGAWPENNFLIK